MRISDWSSDVCSSDLKPNASRKASKAVLDAITGKLPELIGGSADLGESNCTDFKGHVSLRAGKFAGNYINYGVREFGMAAAMNGIALHGGLIPFGGTFLVFSDYARNAIRMAALMKKRSVSDRKSVVEGKSVSVRVDIGGSGIIKNKKTHK